MDDFPKKALECHNECRHLHQVPELTWSPQLASEAQEWANKLARSRTLQHASRSERKEAGENIAMFTGRYDTAAEEATRIWYGEVEKFKFSNPSFQSGTGHFSQIKCIMSRQTRVEQRTYQVVRRGGDFDKNANHIKSEVVWKDSKELGMARAKTPDGRNTYVVSRYHPAGNVMGRFEENVFPSKSKDAMAPSFMRSKPSEEQSQVIDRSWQSPSGNSQTRVVVKETRTQTPQGVKTVRSTTTWTSSATAQSAGKKQEVGKLPSQKFAGTKTEPPTSKFKSLDINLDTKSKASAPRAPASKSPLIQKRNSPREEPVSTGSFQDQALKLHNHYRRLHQASDLRWSNELAREAKAWAEKIARTNTLQHASSKERNGAGENLAYFGGRFDNVAKESTDMWYNEVKKYSFGNPGFKSGTGHFTQLVWKDSKELGMAWAKSPDGRSAFVVARYRPAGNMMGSFDKNVFPSRK